MPIQPLSRVVPPNKGMDLRFMNQDTMAQRPKLAALIAETIAEWSQVECSLGVILAVILQTEAQTGLAMFLTLTNSNNQMAVVSAAAKAKLAAPDEELFSAILSLIRSVAKDRHKFAHWCWAYTSVLPEALLLIAPMHQAPWLANMLGYHDPIRADISHEDIYVLREQDARDTLQRMRATRGWLWELIGIINEKIDRQKCDERRQRLSSEPPILEALSRLRQDKKSDL